MFLLLTFMDRDFKTRNKVKNITTWLQNNDKKRKTQNDRFDSEIPLFGDCVARLSVNRCSDCNSGSGHF